jgi:transposase
MSKRYVGLDAHKNYLVAAAVGTNQELVMKPVKIASIDFATWIDEHLTAEDEVVIEAMSGAWVIHDLLIQRVARVVVAHPYHVKLIAASMIKTDKRDAITLARLLAANIIPEVWVPPKHVRELRSLIYHRNNLVHRRAAAKNRLHGICLQFRIIAPEGVTTFTPEYLNSINLPSVEKLRVRHISEEIHLLTQNIQEAEGLISQMSAQSPWVEDVPYLLQLPGIGILTAITILSSIGEIGRFPSSKHLASYAGLCSRIHFSGNTFKTGGITKQGRGELRYAMIEAAWNAIKYSSFWSRRYEQLSHRMDNQKAATAIARMLLIVIWNVLTKREIDRAADLNMVGKSILIWCWKNRLATSLGMKPAEFAGKHLASLGIKLERIKYCSRVYPLPASDVCIEIRQNVIAPKLNSEPSK